MLGPECDERILQLQNREETEINCCSHKFLQTIPIEEGITALRNSASFRAIGNTAYDMYIKTCILLSLRKLEKESNLDEVWPTKVHYFAIPSSQRKVCKFTFLFLMVLKKTKFYGLYNSALESKSIYTPNHGLVGRLGPDSNKFDDEKRIATQNAIQEIFTGDSIASLLSICTCCKNNCCSKRD